MSVSLHGAGHAKILDSVREVVGLHKERYVFPVSILVSKVSGTGDDALFMGVVKVSRGVGSVKGLGMESAAHLTGQYRVKH